MVSRLTRCRISKAWKRWAVLPLMPPSIFIGARTSLWLDRWYVHFASLFLYHNLLLFVDIYHIGVQYLYYFTCFACLIAMGEQNTGALNLVEKASSRHHINEAPWYVSNVSIISDIPCLFYINCYMFYIHFISYYDIYWTNLLTRCHNARSLFSAVFRFRKVTQEIFSELDGTKTQPPIFPTRTRSPKGRRRGATTPPHHVVARPHLWSCGDMVWGPRVPLTILLKPIYTPLTQKP